MRVASSEPPCLLKYSVNCIKFSCTCNFFLFNHFLRVHESCEKKNNSRVVSLALAKWLQLWSFWTQEKLCFTWHLCHSPNGARTLIAESFIILELRRGNHAHRLHLLSTLTLIYPLLYLYLTVFRGK